LVDKEINEKFFETKVLGEKIAFFRKKKGLSQEALAIMIGKTRSTVTAYENNIAEITIPILLQIAKALDITLYDFVYSLDINKTQGNTSNAEINTTYVQELEEQVKDLKVQLELTKKELEDSKNELNDKNKIIALLEERKSDVDKKLKQAELLYSKIIKKI
jgi:transcriptional regulator with XRE-family HTH domain